MRIFSIVEDKWVNATPNVDAATNSIVGYTVGDSNIIEPPELFYTPTPIDWDNVRIQAAINAAGALSKVMAHSGTTLPARVIASKAVKVANALIEELQNENKQ